MKKYLFPLALVAGAVPAHADHGLSGHGGTMRVMGPLGLERGQWSLGLSLGLDLNEGYSDAELVALAAKHIHAHSSGTARTVVATAAYGLTDRLTLMASLPHVRRPDIVAGEHDHSQTTVNFTEELGTVDGFGDATAMLHANLLRWQGGGFAVVGGVKAPTGGTHAKSPEGERLETEHQSGSGSWDLIAGASIGVGRGHWTLNASTMRQWAGEGAQATRLGDRSVTGAAFAWSTVEAHDDGEHAHGHDAWIASFETTYETEGRMKVGGEIEADSGGKVVWASPGVAREWASGWSAGASVGIPVWQHTRASHPERSGRVSLSLGKRF